ncbi:MAG: hypothetical protein AB8I08_37055 [Sandaracinaceae bacterium]
MNRRTGRPLSKRLLGALVLFTCGGLLAGCDEAPPSIPTGRDAAATTDAGRRVDSGRPGDAGRPDAGRLDSGRGDAAALDAGDSGGCDTLTMDEPTVRATAFVSQEDPVSLAVRLDGALVAWVAFVDGEPRVSVLHLSADGAPSVSGVADDTASAQRDPQIAATREGYVVVWRDDRDGDIELMSRALNPDGTLDGPAVALTDNGVDDPAASVGLTGDGGVLVAWADPDGGAGHVLALGVDGTPGTAQRLPLVTGLRGTPVLAPLPSGAAIAWVDDASGGVRVLRLGPSGTPEPPATAIAAEANATGGLDIAGYGEGAVLLYDVNVGGADPQVRYQSLDEDAAAVGPEQVLSGIGRRAVSGSFSRFSSGFAAVFRSNTLDGEAELQFTVFEPGEDAFAVTGVGSLETLSGPPPTLRSAPDGRYVALAWADDGRVLTTQSGCE